MNALFINGIFFGYLTDEGKENYIEYLIKTKMDMSKVSWIYDVELN